MADVTGNNSRLPAGALFSTAFPAVGIAAGALDSNGADMVPLNLDASGNLKIAGNFTATLGGTTNVNITEVGGLPVVLGQALMSASFPVVIASDQSAIPVSGSFSATTNPTNFATVASTTGTPAPLAVKVGSGTLYGINLFCTNTAYPVYLKIYNLGTASISSASTPAMTLGVSPGAVNNATLPAAGIAFGTSISYQITKFVGANDTTAVAVNDLVGWIAYL